LIIETQIHSNKIVEDARLRQEAVATKDMARNIKKYEDLKSDLKKQESKLSEATTDDERTEINNNIKELKEDISTIRDQQSNIFQNTFSEQYINELSKIDPTLKQLWLEIINISNDFEIKMDKISELQAKISDISVEQIQNAKQVASAIKPKNQKT
jgi:hypothetical protein